MSLQEESDGRTMDQGTLLQVCRLLLLLLLVPQDRAGARQTVPVLWMMPAGSGPGNSSEAVAAAVGRALQDLQRQPGPLGNYQIQLQPLYSKVGSGSAPAPGSSS